MKKLKTSINEYYGNFHLYIEDIKDIIEVLETSNAKSIELVINDYKLDDIADILNNINFNNIMLFKITASSPYVYIEYYGNDIRIYISENTNENIGLFEKLKTIIVRTQNTKLIKFKKIIGNLSGLPLGAYIAARASSDSLKAYDLFAVFYFAFVLLYTFKPTKNKGTIYNSYRNNRTTFWSRNKDNLLVNLFFLILGSFFTFLFQKFLM